MAGDGGAWRVEPAVNPVLRDARYLDLVARTAADQHAIVEITDLAADAAQALALPDPGAWR